MKDLKTVKQKKEKKRRRRRTKEKKKCMEFSPHRWRPSRCVDCGKKQKNHINPLPLPPLPQPCTNIYELDDNLKFCQQEYEARTAAILQQLSATQKRQQQEYLRYIAEIQVVSSQIREQRVIDHPELLVECCICCEKCFVDTELIQPEELSQCNISAHKDSPVCTKCFKQQVQFHVEQKNVKDIRCPVAKCNQRMKYKDMMHLKTSEIISRNLFDKYNRFLCDLEAENHKTAKVRYCSQCNEGHFLNGTMDTWQCKMCHSVECFHCQTVYHKNITCEEIELLRKLIDKSGLSEDWIDQNTKQCPKCTTNIERDGGCFKVRCTNCQSRICWHCVLPFPDDDSCYAHLRSEHDGYY